MRIDEEYCLNGKYEDIKETLCSIESIKTEVKEIYQMYCNSSDSEIQELDDDEYNNAVDLFLQIYLLNRVKDNEDLAIYSENGYEDIEFEKFAVSFGNYRFYTKISNLYIAVFLAFVCICSGQIPSPPSSVLTIVASIGGVSAKTIYKKFKIIDKHVQRCLFSELDGQKKTMENLEKIYASGECNHKKFLKDCHFYVNNKCIIKTEIGKIVEQMTEDGILSRVENNKYTAKL